MTKREGKILIFAVLCMFLAGCLPLLIGAAGYTLTVAKSSSNKMLKGYADYKLGMGNVNHQRSLKGLDPDPVLSYREWKEQLDKNLD